MKKLAARIARAHGGYMTHSPTTPRAAGAHPLTELTDAELTAAIAEAGSIRKLAKATGVPRTTIQDELYRRGLRGTEAAPKLRPAATPPAFADAALVKEHGLDPSLFEVSGASTTETDGDDFSASSVKYSFRRRKPALGPAAGERGPVPSPLYEEGVRATYVILSDHHAPHADEELHQCSLAVIGDLRAEGDFGGVLLLGDLLDLPTLSRHQAAPGEADAQECIDEGYRILADIREAAGEEARMVQLWGNHDVRVARWTASNASPVAMIKQAGGREVLSLEHLLRTDDLGIETVHGKNAPAGAYQLATFEVVPGRLAAIHGNRARKGAGNSALSTAKDRGYGVIQGHTHRLAISTFTNWTTDGRPRPFHAVEAGTMSCIDDGMGYAPAEARDWQQGFVILTVWEDGAHAFEPALYCRGSLTFRNRRYRFDDATGRVISS